MNKLVPEDLYSLEAYAKVRDEYRTRVMEHKRHRRLQLGAHVLLLFEDRLTIQYQVQEMLRIERIFEEAGILEELDAYNPLIPDGSNWKATMMIQYPDPDERRGALERLVGIEDRVRITIDGYDPVFAIADEDLDRATESKTSSVHFLRFELTPAMCDAVKHGASLDAGIDHPGYSVEAPLPEPMRESLIADLA
ncbi:MAG: DUF3501 family protein [Gammaproteobacteria bacterium]|nr:DUF3501 family protein [Gammaproteobacteria bacterium]